MTLQEEIKQIQNRQLQEKSGGASKESRRDKKIKEKAAKK